MSYGIGCRPLASSGFAGMPSGRLDEVEFAAPFILPWMPREDIGYQATERTITLRAGPQGAYVCACAATRQNVHLPLSVGTTRTRIERHRLSHACMPGDVTKLSTLLDLHVEAQQSAQTLESRSSHPASLLAH